MLARVRVTSPLVIDDELFEAIAREFTAAMDEHTQRVEERWRAAIYEAIANEGGVAK